MNLTELNKVAVAMVTPGKGILAADESSGTIKKRFDAIKVESTEENRRDYREMLFRSSEAMSKYISGVILYDETIWQNAKDGTPLVKLIEQSGAIPGIKVDEGTQPLPQCPGELVTVGLDKLAERLKKYYERGARFAKWRAVIDIGAGIPSMTVSPEEIGAFVASADALLVNLGTFDRERREAVGIAVDTARETGKPWVLDPVFIDRSADRGRFAQELLAKSPRIIRLNGSEYGALFDEPAQADVIQARALAGGVTIAVSGASDCVSDGRTPVICGNGHPFLQKVTAIGCAEAALMSAFVSVTREPILAAIAGHIVMGVAGEIAAQKAQGLGSFSVHLIDALHAMDDAILSERARLS